MKLRAQVWVRSELCWWFWMVKVGGAVVSGGTGYGRRHDAERGGVRWCRRCGFKVEVVRSKAETEIDTLWR
jgi:hypothetical protein